MIKPVLIAVTVAVVTTATVYFSPLDKGEPAVEETLGISISQPTKTQEPTAKRRRMPYQPREHKNAFSIPPGTFVVGLGMPTLLYVLASMGKSSKPSLQPTNKVDENS